MKKTAITLTLLLASFSIGLAENVNYWNQIEPIELASSTVNVPTGAFFNERKDMVYVQKGWLRILTNGIGKEYDYTSEMDPYGNYVLTFYKPEAKCYDSITIYSGGRTLYYNGETYQKN